MHTLGFDTPPNDKTAIEHLQDAPPVHLPVRSGPMFRVFTADLVSGPVTFPNSGQPLSVAPDWWIVILTDDAARLITITRSGGDDLTVPLPQDSSTAFRTFKVAFPGLSKTITINAQSGAVYATVIAVIGYSPKDILP